MDRRAGAVPVPSATAARSTFTAQVIAHIRRLTIGQPAALRALTERHGKFLRSTLVQACAATGRTDPQRLVRLGRRRALTPGVAGTRRRRRPGRQPARRAGDPRRIGDEAAILAGLSCFAMAGLEAAELGEVVNPP